MLMCWTERTCVSSFHLQSKSQSRFSISLTKAHAENNSYIYIWLPSSAPCTFRREFSLKSILANYKQNCAKLSVDFLKIISLIWITGPCISAQRCPCSSDWTLWHLVGKYQCSQRQFAQVVRDASQAQNLVQYSLWSYASVSQQLEG